MSKTRNLWYVEDAENQKADCKTLPASTYQRNQTPSRTRHSLKFFEQDTAKVTSEEDPHHSQQAALALALAVG
jgi:hypothetical protein